jgi:antitoxin component HigA of HigAB toxin-antitoxin module
MKSFQTRGVVAIALVTALGIVTPAVAFGATTTTTTAPGTTTTVKATLTNPWQQWRHAQEAYVDQLEVIRHTFHSTVKTARDAFRAAVRASQGSANRAALIAAARAALTLSIANAMGARSTALIALGNPPTPPAGTFGDTALITTTPGTARSAHIVALQAINETYRTAVASAQATFGVDFSTASTRAERATVRAALELARANAAVARAAALTTLGPPPVKNSATTATTVPVTTTTP